MPGERTWTRSRNGSPMTRFTASRATSTNVQVESPVITNRLNIGTIHTVPRRVWMALVDRSIALLGLTADELCDAAAIRLASGHGIALSVYKQVMHEGRFAPEEFGVPDRTATAWRENFHFELPDVVRTESESAAVGGDTVKTVLRRSSGLEYESVRIPMGEGRASLCVSSQIGCGRACRFCETGRMGFLDNLSVVEIVGQVVLARTLATKDSPAPQAVVFMGMGEALDNTDSLIQVLRVLNDSTGLRYAQDRLTVCTVGHVAGIRRLRELGWKRLNLSLSLNAANDELRQSLMPINRTWPLAEVQAALVEFRQRPNFQVGINYCLMPDINDQREHAAEIARFCEPLGRSMVYLIPYNPGSHPITRAPESAEVDRFIGWLRDEGLSVRRRITKGRDVMAACGQLGNLNLRNR